MKKLHLIASASAILAVASSAHATLIDGGLAAGATGSFTSSSLTLSGTQFVESSSGDFSPEVQSLSGLTAYSSTISGLSSTALAVNIADYFSFSSTLIAPGTTPSDRFEFNLTSLTETFFGSGIADFSGTGTIVDTTGAFADTAATFTLGFSGPASESFSMSTVAAPVPEPTTIVAGASMLLPFGVGALRILRKSRKA
jgi:hypothetical protein